MRWPGLAFVACLAIALVVLLTRDPDEPWAVAILIVAVGGAAASAATWLLARRGGARRRGARATGVVAGRRGLEVGAVVALLLWLRAVDGLSLVTTVFVVAAFAVAELLLAARPHSSR